jgi:limonene-1,2-epoxide hydrolase
MTAMYAPDGVFVDPRHPPFVGHAAIRAWYDTALANFSQAHVDYTRVVVDPPNAVAEWVSYLSHGDTRYAFHGTSVFEVHDGRVTFQRDYFDQKEDAELRGKE